MIAVTIQELSQSRNLLSSIPKQKASVTLSFPFVLKNRTSSLLKSEIYHPLPDSAYFKTYENLNFDVHNPTGIKLLNRLRLNFSHLNDHKFCHNFRDIVNLFCLCTARR